MGAEQTLKEASGPYQRLEALGLALPSAPKPVANFVTGMRDGDLLFLSGQGPLEANGTEHHGKVGRTVTVEEAQTHARITGLNLIAVMHETLGSLDKVKQVMKVFGMVNADPDFERHPEVIDGCSNLFVEVFGDAGRHARSAVGMGSLPNGMTVEIEAVIKIHD